MNISIIIPVYNEELCLSDLHARLLKVLNNLNVDWEILYIDDGSYDNTFPLISKFRESDNRIKIIKFKRNYGQQPALMAGFKYAKGDVAITMDADLQNEPEDIPKFLAEIEKGYDAVYGWRKKRKDPIFMRKIPSYFGNLMVSRFSGVRLHDYQCNFRAFKRNVVEYILDNGEAGKLPSLLGAIGAAKAIEIPVGHSPRRLGESKYDFKALSVLALDIITGYSTRPFQFVGMIGLLFFVMAFGLSGFYILMRLFYEEHYDRLLLFTLIMLFMGLQFIILGFLGEYIIRIYNVSVKKPMYKIETLLD